MGYYVLLKDFDWFGKTIKAGAIYRSYESSPDKFRCYTIDGRECPHWDLTFMTVKVNGEWFFPLNETAIRTAFKPQKTEG